MIKLFVLDLDGCISIPFETPDWGSITEIRNLNRDSRNSDIIPPITLCTGRPHPYAEAVAQWLDIRLPFVFESAGMFDWDTNRVVTSLEENGQSVKPILEMKQWLKEEILPDHPNTMPEFSKMMDAGVVSNNIEEIHSIYDAVLNHTSAHYPQLEVHRTDVSVNILIRGNNKLAGLKLLSKALDIDLKQMAYIGDSSGDIPALREVGHPFAPDNAIADVKKIAHKIPKKTTKAVLQAYRMIIEKNRQLSSSIS